MGGSRFQEVVARRVSTVYQKGTGELLLLKFVSNVSYSLDLDEEENLTKVFTCHWPNVVNR